MSIYTSVAVLSLVASALVAQENPSWNNWRGPNHNAVASTGNPPTEWNEEDGKNIKWKVRIPGRGSSSPIIWNNRIYVTTAIPLDKDGKEAPIPAAASRGGSGGSRGRGGFGGSRGGNRRGGDQDRGDSGRRRGGGRRGGFGRSRAPSQQHEFVVIAYDRSNGKEVWKTTVNSTVPHAGTHSTGTQASNSPLTDGKHIYAYFGSHGIHRLDMQGKVKWSKDLGKMRTRNSFGEGSSPALHGDTLVINWDHEDDSFIVAFDKNSGEEKWRKSRDERTTWSTPLIIEVDGKAQVVVAATNASRSYDLETGKLVWTGPGLTNNVIPTPIFDNGLLYLMSGFRGNSMIVINPKGAKGELTDEDIVWKHGRNCPYTPSGIIYDGNIYFTQSNSAILSCLDAKSGEVQYERERLRGIRSIYSSPVAAAGRIYITGRQGTTKVIKAGSEFEEIATNKLEDTVDSTIAVVGDELIIRGWQNLYCIAEAEKKQK